MASDGFGRVIRHAAFLGLSVALIYASMWLVTNAPGETALHSRQGFLGILGGVVGALGAFANGVDLFNDVSEVVLNA